MGGDEPPAMVVNLADGRQAFTSNVYLVPGDRTVLVDPGANFDVVDQLRAHASAIDAVVLTHTHPDHVGNLADVVRAFDAEVVGFDPDHEGVDAAIADGDTVRMGDDEYVALHTPGHKGDHLCFYAAEPGVLFSGDLVFQNGSFGRTDLPEGNRRTLIESLDRLLETVDGTLAALHPGHGPSVRDQPYRHIELARRFADTD